MSEQGLEQRLQRAATTLERLRAEVGKAVVGQRTVVEQVLLGLLAGGHVLLEGAPGLGKTLLVRTLAAATELRFSRIQFTPDLMPSDVLGTQVLVDLPAGGRGFSLHRGPIFGQLVLADEINRATPKTQSALLEAMAEGAVTIGGTRHELEQPFCVLATENPIEQEGTYPLPEAQLDRFLLKVLVPDPTEEELVAVLARTTARENPVVEPVLHGAELLALRALCRDVSATEQVLRYAARLVRLSSPAQPEAPALVKRALRYGAGVRAGQSLVLAAKAWALLQGRPHVAFQDVAAVTLPCLRHRLLRSFEGEADGISTDAVLSALLEAVPPRPPSVEAELRRGSKT